MIQGGSNNILVETLLERILIQKSTCYHKQKSTDRSTLDLELARGYFCQSCRKRDFPSAPKNFRSMGVLHRELYPKYYSRSKCVEIRERHRIETNPSPIILILSGSFSHGFTYSGHPVSCAVALEALKLYKERNVVEQVQRLSPRFQDGLKAFSDSPIVGEIRGTGLILGMEFTDNKSPNDLFPPEWAVGAYFGAECEKRGMLVRVAGDNIMLCPPFVITPEEIDELISIFGEALKATEDRVKELKSKKKQE